MHDWIVSSPRKPSQDNKHNSHEIRNKARWNCKAIILQQANPKSTWEKEKWHWWKLFPLCFYFPMSKCISLTPRKGVKEKTSWPLTIRGRKGRNSLEMRGLRAFIVHCQFISHTASPLFANFKPTSSSLWLLPLTLFAFQLIIITICFHYRSFVLQVNVNHSCYSMNIENYGIQSLFSLMVSVNTSIVLLLWSKHIFSKDKRLKSKKERAMIKQ